MRRFGNVRRKGLVGLATLSLLLGDTDAATPVKRLDDLRAVLRESAELRVLHLPYDLATRVNVSPKAMEGYTPLFQRRISREEDPAIFAALETALAQTDAQPTMESPDVRWGCVLYTSRGRRIGSFYLERKYRNRSDITGVFGGTTVIVNTALLRWFERSFPEAARM